MKRAVFIASLGGFGNSVSGASGALSGVVISLGRVLLLCYVLWDVLCCFSLLGLSFSSAIVMC